MPISGPASYLPTTDEFLAHWSAANTALGAGNPITVFSGKTRANLLTLRTQLETARATVEILRNAREGERTNVETLKATLLARLNQFVMKIRSLSPGTKWENMLPKAYSITDGMGRVIPALDDVADIWSRYETETASQLQLMDSYPLGDFLDGLTALKAGYTALSSADKGLGLQRGNRTELENQIQPILKAYRQRIPAEFPEGSALLATLPRLTPIPGSTPDPVVANGTFNALTLTARPELDGEQRGRPRLLRSARRVRPGLRYGGRGESGNHPARRSAHAVDEFRAGHVRECGQL